MMSKINSNGQPVVSILCTTYNHSKFIRQALDSFLMQKTDFDFEILINDDASTDGTTEILKEYQKKYPKIIKPKFQKENQFSKGIRNMMIRFLLPKAKGKYLALCEGDDYWTDPNKLQKQVDFMEKNKNYTVCFHPVKVFFENGEKAESIFPNFKSGFVLKRLLEGNFIQTNSVMYRRQKYENLATDVMPGDWYLHLYHAQFGKIGFINKVMSTYRKHEGGIWYNSGATYEFLKQHGIGYLHSFHEFLGFYGDNDQYKKIILDKAADYMQLIVNSDKKDSRRQLSISAITKFPEFAAHLVSRQYQNQSDRDELEALRATIDKLNREKQQIFLSKTFRIGRVVLSAPRFLRSLLVSIQEAVMASFSKKVTVIVPVYGDWESLEQNIISLKKTIPQFSKHKVLFANDCGPDADLIEKNILELIKYRKNFYYYRNEKNLGFVKSCNNAVFNLSDKNTDVLILNSDTKVTKGFLRAMLKVLYSQKDIAVVTPRSNHATVFSIPAEAGSGYDYPPEKSYKLYKEVKKELPEKYISPTAHGFCMLIKREAIDRYGLFDEIYGRGYGEENDFCMRLRAAGYKCAIANQAYVFHMGARNFSPETREHSVKVNEKILIKRYPDYYQLVQQYIDEVVLPEQQLFQK